MGITKRPSSNCSDEIVVVEIDDVVEDTISSNDSSEESDGSDHSGYAIYYPNLENNEAYYRHYLRQVRPQWLQYLDDIEDTDVDPKPKKKNVNNVKQMGRRKANRALNESFLLSLNDGQQHPEDDIFYNDNKNGFTKVVNSLRTRPDLKESIIEGNDELVLKKGKKAEINNDKKLKRSICPDIAFKNLTTSQKSLFKQKSLPFAAIDHLETEIFGYFTLVPNGIYTSAPLPSYHRMLLHSIVRYYSLDATSVNSRGHRAQKIVQVRNSYYDDFQPPRMSLLKFISSQNRRR